MQKYYTWPMEKQGKDHTHQLPSDKERKKEGKFKWVHCVEESKVHLGAKAKKKKKEDEDEETWRRKRSLA